MGRLASQQRLVEADFSSAVRRFEALAAGKGTPAFVGRVFTNASLPTSAGRFFSVHPVTILGQESEGSPGSFLVDSSLTIPVFVVGPHPPALGDDLICRFVGSRWVADRMGGGGTTVSVTIPGCLCAQTPSTLHMSSSNTTSDDGMFQNCTILYGPTPPEYAALGLGEQSFLSTSSFTDGSTGDSFRYYFSCNSAIYSLSRVYATSFFGSPFKDSIRYAWLIGAPGNTCTPFLLSKGQIFLGGNLSCVVTISG